MANVQLQFSHVCLGSVSWMVVLSPQHPLRCFDVSEYGLCQQSMFEPVEVAAGLWIVPNWRAPPVSHTNSGAFHNCRVNDIAPSRAVES